MNTVSSVFRQIISSGIAILLSLILTCREFVIDFTDNSIVKCFAGLYRPLDIANITTIERYFDCIVVRIITGSVEFDNKILYELK